MSEEKNKSLEKASRVSQNIYGPLVGLFFVGFALRWFRFNESGFWLDEAGMCFRVDSLESVFGLHDGSPPAYALLVYLLSLVFGNSDGALRITSLMASALLAPAAFYFISRSHSRWCAWLVAVMACVNPVSYFYAHEFKPYSFLSLMVLVQVGTLARILYEDESPNLSTYLVASGSTITVVLTHQYGLLATAAAALLCLMRVPQLTAERRKSVLRLLGYTLIVTILLWIPTTWKHLFMSAHNQAAASQSPFWSKYDPRGMFALILGFFFSSPMGVNDVNLLTPSTLFVAACTFGLAFTSRLKKPEFFWAWHLLLSVFFACLVQSVWPHYWARRYESAFLGVAIVVAGLALSKIEYPRLRNGVTLFVVGLLIWTQYLLLTFPVSRSSSRDVARFISASQVNASLVTLQRSFDPLMMNPLIYYLGRGHIDLVGLPRLEKLKYEYLGPSLFYRQQTELELARRRLTAERIAEFLSQNSYKRISIVGAPSDLAALPRIPGWEIVGFRRFASFRENNVDVVLWEKQP